MARIPMTLSESEGHCVVTNDKRVARSLCICRASCCVWRKDVRLHSKYCIYLFVILNQSPSYIPANGTINIAVKTHVNVKLKHSYSKPKMKVVFSN